MACPYCGAAGNDSGEYCSNCGLIYLKSCPNCEAEVPTGEMICPQCGAQVWSLRGSPTERTAPLSPPGAQHNREARLTLMHASEAAVVAAPPGSRQQAVSVLCAHLELAGNDANLERPQSQPLSLFNQMTTGLAQAVEGSGGYLHEYNQAGLTVVFGLPDAREDDPEKALQVGFKMLEMARQMNADRPQAADLRVRIRLGIHTGALNVIPVGDASQEVYRLTGKTLELAALLCQSAPADALLVDRATYLRTRTLCDFQPASGIGSVVLNREEMIYRAEHLKERTQANNIPPDPGPAQVGRIAELERMQAALNRARRGLNHVVFISAEAGMGKTHLVRRFQMACARDTRRFRLISLSASGLTQSTSYRLAGDLVNAVTGVREDDPLPLRRQTLRDYLERMDLPGEEYTTYLGKLFTTIGFETGHLRSLDDFDPEQARMKTYAVMRSLLIAEARLRTLVLVFDDVHFSDPSSLAMLKYLLGAMQRSGVLFVFSVRSGEEGLVAGLFEIARRHPDDLTEIQLQPLPDADARRLVERMIAPTPLAEAPGVVEHIVGNARGSPFVVHEMLRLLLERLDTGSIDKAATPVERIVHLTARLPGNVEDLALARIKRLPVELRLLLQKAAVLGAAFDLSTLIRTGHEQERALQARLRELGKREFLVPDAFGYSFQSSLVQQAVYESIPPDERQKLHDQAATAIHANQTWFGAGMVEELCRHYLHGSMPRRAIPYLFRSASEALAHYDHPAAIARYRQALEILSASPSAPEQREALLGLGRALKLNCEYEQTFTTLEAALAGVTKALREQPGSPQIQRWRLELIAELADTRLRQGRLEESKQITQDGLKLLGSEVAAEQIPIWRALTASLAWAEYRLGNLQQAVRLVRAGLKTALVNDPRERLSTSSLYFTHGCVHLAGRDILEAKLYLEKSLSLAKSANHLEGIATAYAALGELNLATGDLAGALQDFELSLDIARRTRDVRLQAYNRIGFGNVRLALGEIQAAREHIEAGLEICERIGDAWNACHAYIGLAIVAHAAAGPAAVLEYVSPATRLAHATGSRELQVQARAIDALAWSAMNNPNAGVDAARSALNIARASGYVGGELFCLQTLAFALGAKHEWQAAEDALKSGLALARGKFDRFHEAHCTYLLAENMRLRAQTAAHGEVGALKANASRLYAAAAAQFAVLGARRFAALAQQMIKVLEKGQEA